MSPSEIAYRLRHRLQIEIDRRTRPPQVVPSRVVGARLVQHLLPALDIVEIHERFPLEVQATVDAADALLQNRITIFGKEFCLATVDNADRQAEKPAQHSGAIDWHRDPQTGKRWPFVFWANINIRDGTRVGGVKWVWELNRGHHLVTLAKAYALTGDERYAQAVCTHLHSWIEQNPPYMGVNWTNSLELAVRLINWSWALALLESSQSLRDAVSLVPQILGSISAQAAYIARYLSAYSSANNHLMGEAAGLAIVGLCYPSLQQAKRWRDTGLDILRREIGRQILPDGVPAEQAVHYLAFILDFNLLVWEVAERCGIAAPAIWHERLAAACDFLRHIQDSAGKIPHIGDSDDAWVVRLDDRPNADNFRSILASAAARLHDPACKVAAGRWDEKSHWLLGDAGRAAFDALPQEAAPLTSKVFPGGYGVLRTQETVALFDCGPLGYLSIAAHGHADALSLTLSHRGHPLLIDPGTYTYHEGREWRDHLRGTSAHNTLVVDDRDQSEMLGTFLWGRKANSRLLAFHTSSDHTIAVGEHDGYAHLGITHRRTLILARNGWLFVIDLLHGSGSHTFEQFWHCAPQSSIVQKAEAIQVNVAGESLFIVPLLVPSVDTKSYFGSQSPLQGWYSAHYGQIEPAPVVSLRSKEPVHAPARIVTGLYFGDSIPEHFSEDGHLHTRSQLLAWIHQLEDGIGP